MAAHPNGMSVVDQGELKGRTLQELIEMYGVSWGVSEDRFLRCSSCLSMQPMISVQVHPDDDYAAVMKVMS